MDNKITNKKVLIVGGASNIELFEKPEYFDTIIRINHGYPVGEEIKKMTSDRCDILYCYYSIIEHKEWRRIGELRIRLSYLKFYSMQRDTLVQNKFRHYNNNLSVIDFEKDKKFCDTVGCKINAGLLAIMDILYNDPAELFITGISFYKNNFHCEYRLPKKKKDRINKLKGEVYGHNQQLQFEYFKKHIFPLEHVFTDNFLYNICFDSDKIIEYE